MGNGRKEVILVPHKEARKVHVRAQLTNDFQERQFLQALSNMRAHGEGDNKIRSESAYSYNRHNVMMGVEAYYIFWTKLTAAEMRARLRHTKHIGFEVFHPDEKHKKEKRVRKAS